MKVRVHPGDRKGVGHYRLRYPAQAASAHGIEVQIADSLPIIRGYLPSNLRQQRIAPQTIDADVLVFQRISNPEVVALIPAFQARGHAVVIDVDDDLHAIHANNIARSATDPRMVLRACALADLVTVSTPALAARYAPHGRVAVLANCVPAELLRMPKRSDGATVGWSGTVRTHPDDLAVTHGGVQQALSDTGARFHVIGDEYRVKAQLGLLTQPTATGGIEIDAYHQALGELDVGICPLRESKANIAKSALKPLEMTARGAAVVMSPLPEYAALGAQGVGVLAKPRARDWRARIRELLANPDLRAELVAQGQQVIRERCTYETEGWRWAEAWTDARQTAVQRRAARLAA